MSPADKIGSSAGNQLQAQQQIYNRALENEGEKKSSNGPVKSQTSVWLNVGMGL